MANPLKKIPNIKWPGTKEAMIAVAASQIGYSETGNNDTYFGRWYGLNNSPWCAMFISWSAFISGNKSNIPKHAYTPAGADWFKRKGQWGSKPRVGAIAYYDTAGLGRISHVGVVDQVFGDGSWTSIEGNTNAAGSREGRVVRRQKRRTAGSRGGFGYPTYAKVPDGAKVPTPAKPVDLSRVIAKAKKDIFDGRVASALKAEGHTADMAGYRKWQRSLGLSANDADGIPGKMSLTALGKKHGWKVKA